MSVPTVEVAKSLSKDERKAVADKIRMMVSSARVNEARSVFRNLMPHFEKHGLSMEKIMKEAVKETAKTRPKAERITSASD